MIYEYNTKYILLIGGESPPQKSDQREATVAEKRACLEASIGIVDVTVAGSRATAECATSGSVGVGDSAATIAQTAAAESASVSSPAVAAASATASGSQGAPPEHRARVHARRNRTAFTRRQLECM